MFRHRHHHGGGPYVPILGRPFQSSCDDSANPVQSFSLRFEHALRPSDFSQLSALGLTCEADVANLTCDELVALSKGSIVEGKASSMIELANAVVKSRAFCSQPTVNNILHTSPPPPSDVACKAPMRVQWCQRAGRSLLSEAPKPWLEAMWEVYVKLGARGLQYSPLTHTRPELARAAFEAKINVFEVSSLKGHFSAWKRWVRFVTQSQPVGAEPTVPSLDATFSFLQANAARGPTVAQSLFQQMLWWRAHVGVPFPTHDPLLAVWNRPSDSRQSTQREPLPICVVTRLAEAATGPCPIASAFAGFALMPLVACLRFAHLQRSTQLRRQGPFLFGICTKGKSREQRVRKPFEWACPQDFLGQSDVFRSALLVLNDLRGRLQAEPAFVIPDLLLGPSSSVGPDATWSIRPMSIAKFIALLRVFISQLCRVDTTQVTSYSLRRFLPTIAEIVRCPPEIAQHLGNWTESVSLKHAPSSRMVMSQYYAHDKVATAADSKAALLQAIAMVQKQLNRSEVTFQALRDSGILWSALQKCPSLVNVDVAVTSPSKSLFLYFFFFYLFQ